MASSAKKEAMEDGGEEPESLRIQTVLCDPICSDWLSLSFFIRSQWVITVDKASVEF